MTDIDLSPLEAPYQPQKNSSRTRTRSEEKRAKIMEAAADLFTEQGFSSTSMDKIAERAGVSKQTVYSHFGSKEGVFSASIEAKCILNSLSSEFFLQQAPTAHIMMELARHFNDLLLSNDTIRIMRLCCANAESHPEVSELLYSAGVENLHRLLSDFLAQRAAGGELDIPNTDAAANQFLFMINGDEAFRARLGLEPKLSNQEQDDYLKSSVRIFLKGYRSER